MSNFWKAFMITAIPIIVLSLISTGKGSFDRGTGEDLGILGIWFVAAALWAIALVAAIAFTSRDKKQIAAGTWAGVGIGIVSLGATCFANLSRAGVSIGIVSLGVTCFTMWPI